MSWDFDQQMMTRLMAPITAALAQPLQKIPAEQLMHGTTIGAFAIENGTRAVAFSDGKVSMGNEPVHLAYCKMAIVDPHSVLLFSGSPSLAVQYSRALRSWIGYREDTTNEPMAVRAKELTLESMLLRGIGLMGAGIMLAPILATYDPQKKCARLFSFGPEGSMMERPDFTTSGSGHSIRHTLKERWRSDMSKDEGVAMAQKLIDKDIVNIDSFSGGKVSIAVIGPEGVIMEQG